MGRGHTVLKKEGRRVEFVLRIIVPAGLAVARPDKPNRQDVESSEVAPNNASPNIYSEMFLVCMRSRTVGVLQCPHMGVMQIERSLFCKT
ncbi:hypothetical protein AVEN_104310-1 [Araneus ventricosus]|uniref:Uncharacterized protein n=1 Tax=Araneus ventricosus TaxID=182803 RepID=A0A4Y2BXM6_ARAVE|nr:hypothetical protein AVEN_104310-1 [Araneus ventricosus]